VSFWHWIIDDLNLTHSEKFVSLILVRHQNKEGKCWPSIERISALSGFNVRHVRRILRSLEKKGYLDSISRTGATTVYRLRETASQMKLLDLPTKTVVGDCYLCRGPIYAGESTEIDHVIPRSAGGGNHFSNKRRVHRNCNQIKGQYRLREDISDKDRFPQGADISDGGGGHFALGAGTGNVPQKPVNEAVKDKTPRDDPARLSPHLSEQEQRKKIEGRERRVMQEVEGLRESMAGMGPGCEPGITRGVQQIAAKMKTLEPLSEAEYERRKQTQQAALRVKFPEAFR
jgi:5-methylcytosine-specific restriction endonuclease McrA